MKRQVFILGYFMFVSYYIFIKDTRLNELKEMVRWFLTVWNIIYSATKWSKVLLKFIASSLVNCLVKENRCSSYSAKRLLCCEDLRDSKRIIKTRKFEDDCFISYLKDHQFQCNICYYAL